MKYYSYFNIVWKRKTITEHLPKKPGQNGGPINPNRQSPVQDGVTQTNIKETRGLLRSSRYISSNTYGEPFWEN